MDLLAGRISESVNQLGFQIDLLYKLPQNQRQKFLNRIQSLKNNLLALKSNLKHSNKQLVQNQYKGMRSQIIQLKRNLDVLLQQLKYKNSSLQNRNIQQNRLNAFSKSGSLNRQINKNNQNLFENSNLFRNNFKQTSNKKIGVMKHISKQQYQDLMINIVQKTQLNKQLNDQIQVLKQQNQQLQQSIKALDLKVRQNQSQQNFIQRQLAVHKLNLSTVQRKLVEKQKQIQRLRDDELQNRVDQSKFQIQKSQIKNELDILNQKIINYQNIGQINTCKISILEKDLFKYENQLILLNQKHLAKQFELQKRTKQLQQCEARYHDCMNKISRLQNQLQNQSQDVHVLQNELTKYQRQFYQLKIQKQNILSRLEMHEQNNELEIKEKDRQMINLKQMLIDSQQINRMKQQDNSFLKQKLLQCQQICQQQKLGYNRLRQISIKKERQFQQQRQVYVFDIELKRAQNIKLSQQVRKTLELSKSLQQEINNIHLHKRRIKEDKNCLSIDLKEVQIKNIQLAKSYEQIKRICQQTDRNLMEKQRQLDNVKSRVYQLQNQLKQTRIRLRKAKIQAIYDLKNSLF